MNNDVNNTNAAPASMTCATEGCDEHRMLFDRLTGEDPGETAMTFHAHCVAHAIPADAKITLSKPDGYEFRTVCANGAPVETSYRVASGWRRGHHLPGFGVESKNLKRIPLDLKVKIHGFDAAWEGHNPA